MSKPELLGAANLQGPFPAHQPGDLLLVFSFRSGGGGNVAPTLPAAGNGVPAYTLISSNGNSNGGNGSSVTMCWAWATADNHVTGSFGNASRTISYAIRGADPINPIGGNANQVTGGTTSKNPGAPGVTLEYSDDTSLLFHGVCGWVSNFAWTWSAPPGGFTDRYTQNGASGSGYIGVMALTKDTVTAGTGVTLTSSAILSTQHGASVEIVAPRPDAGTMTVLHGGAWTPSTPKGVMQGGQWKTPQTVKVLQGGAWKPVWP